MTTHTVPVRGRRVAWRARASLGGAAALLMAAGTIAPVAAQQGPPGDAAEHPVLDPIDAQDWVDMADQTWDDYDAVRPDEWLHEENEASDQQFKGAVILGDFEDEPFLVTQEAGSHPFGNPVPADSPHGDFEPVAEDEVADWYHSYFTDPDNEYNGGQTLHGYWMETSHGRLGVDVETYGVYNLEGNLHEYGLAGFGRNVSTSPDEPDSICPDYSETCNRSLRNNLRAAWIEEQGEDVVDEYDFVFFVSAGHDESSTWEEQGRMLFEGPEDIPDEFGPRPGPDAEEGEPVLNHAGEEIPNHAGTRYVDWTSWMAASNHWPNAQFGGSPPNSTQAESSGQSVYAHEFSHVLGLPDNYNNPFADNVRNFTGYWAMMSRGTFNGPGGTHNRWQVPNQGGSGLGPHHMLHFKNQLEVIRDDEQLFLDRDQLADEGVAVTSVKARSRVPGEDIVGVNVGFGEDGYEPGHCVEYAQPRLGDEFEEGFHCPSGTSWENYTIEVSAQEGNDSFVPGHGVLLSQARSAGFPYVWMIDPNPEDIGMIDYHLPDGTPVEVVRGDPRQLNDATFHAGTGSGSAYEYVDEPNDLHVYVIDTHEDEDGALVYDIGVRNTDSSGDLDRDVDLGQAQTVPQRQGFLATCEIPLTNTGEGGDGVFASDVYRLSAESSSDDWELTVPNELAAAEAGETATVEVHALRTNDRGTDQSTTVTVQATSESDPDATAEATCDVHVRDTTPGGGNR